MKAFVVACVAVGAMTAGPDGVTVAGGPTPGPIDDQVAIGAFVYRAGGRRDPFVRPGLDRQTPCGRGGLQGMRVRDVEVRGVVGTWEGSVALLGGPRGESHTARQGDRLCDGKVGAIEPEWVDLERDADPLDSPAQPRTVRRRLHPVE